MRRRLRNLIKPTARSLTCLIALLSLQSCAEQQGPATDHNRAITVTDLDQQSRVQCDLTGSSRISSGNLCSYDCDGNRHQVKVSFAQCQKEVTVSAGSYTLIEKHSKKRIEKNSAPKIDEKELEPQPEGQRSTSCTVEDFRYMEKASHIYISGATSCSRGILHLRLYNSGNNDFLGSKTTYIRGHTFQTFVSAPVPQQLRLEYTVDID